MKSGLLLGLLLICVAIGGIGCANQPTKRDVAQSDSHLRMAMQYYKKRRPRRALQHLYEAEKLNPYSYNGQRLLATHLLHIGRPKEAKKRFMRVVELKPKYPSAWNGLGAFYASQKKWDKALETFHKGLKMVSFQDPCLLESNLGRTYHQVKKLSKARTYLRRAADHCQGWHRCRANLWLGQAAELQRDHNEALTSYQKVVSTCKTYIPGHYAYGRSLTKQKRFEEAARSFNKCLKLCGSSKNCPQIVFRSCNNMLSKVRQQLAQNAVKVQSSVQ